LIPAAVRDGGIIIEPVPFPPGPDPRNLTGTYAASAYQAVGSLGFPTPTSFGTFPSYKSSVTGWEIGGLSTNANKGSLGACRLFLQSTTGADPVFYYLTAFARS